jgi:Xaa-Pro aminopeptidase
MNRRIVSVPDSLSSRSIPGRKPDLRFSPGAWVIADNASFFAVASSRKLPPPLLYASTDHSADVRYFGHATVPDAFIAFGRGKKKYAVVSALEFGRIRRESAFDVVLPLEAWVAKARARWPRRSVGVADVICLLAAELGQTRFTVPQDFPAGLYAKLRRLGLDVTVAEGALFPSREIKTAREAEAIRDGNRCSARGIAAAERLLRASRIKGGRLWHDGRVLTSERLKFAIEVACLEGGAVSRDTIAAGGDQACDPHDQGSGPLRANELIIVDVFPRVTATGYHGDMTRTFLRGRASEAQRALVAAVRAAQLAALRTIRAGVNGRDVHARVNAVFTERGFETKRTSKGSVGFFHGTGHGLGLDIHEVPRVSSVDYVLKRDSVVTVEPGLYYPGLGGCRIEDVVQVKTGAPEMLSRFHYQWEIP